MVCRRFLPATILLTALLTTAAGAEDQIIDAKPCTFMCKVWRNMSGDAQVSFGAPVDNAERATDSALAATDGAGPPDPATLVERRGLVAVETAAERAARLRQRAQLERELQTVSQKAAAMRDRASPRP